MNRILYKQFFVNRILYSCTGILHTSTASCTKTPKISKKANLVSVSIGRVQIYWPHNNLVLDGVHGLGTSTGLGLRPRHCTGPRSCTVSNVNIIGSSVYLVLAAIPRNGTDLRENEGLPSVVVPGTGTTHLSTRRYLYLP